MRGGAILATKAGVNQDRLPTKSFEAYLWGIREPGWAVSRGLHRHAAKQTGIAAYSPTTPIFCPDRPSMTAAVLASAITVGRFGADPTRVTARPSEFTLARKV